MTQRAARRALDNDIALDFTGLFADAGGGETRLSVSPVEPLFTAGEYKTYQRKKSQQRALQSV